MEILDFFTSIKGIPPIHPLLAISLGPKQYPIPTPAKDPCKAESGPDRTQIEDLWHPKADPLGPLRALLS